MSVAEVAAVLARYDDAAWIALANRGLLRRARKDMGIVDVRVVAQTGQAVEVGVGDRLVRMGVAGPGDAECSCPSVVICQHIITAGLWLASAAVGQPDERGQPEQSAQRGEPGIAQPTDALHDDVMALDAAALIAYAGLPGYRWAHQMLDDQETPPRVTRDGYLAITFERPPLTVRYLGGGLDGLVLDQSVSNVKRFRVAAVLAWHRAHGQVLPAPSAPRSRATVEGEASLSRRESRARLRSAVTELLRDTVAIGVSHLSPAIHERLTTAATWAQGVEYHRLALQLRRLADQVDLLLARSAVADDLLLLDDIAVAHALVAALESAAAHGTEPVALVGRARTSYDPVRSLDLVGLGGRPWHTGSGYHGLTCIFWSPSRQQCFTWTDARPDSLEDFDPRARWQQPAPWTGLATPATSAGSRLVLTSAQVSADRRISGVDSTSAAVTALDSDEMASLLPVRSSWRELAPARIHGLSDPFDPTSQWSILRPVQVLPAQWDAANQLLTCALLDDVGATVTLKVSWSRLHAHAIGRLESLGDNFPSGTLVVARVVRRRGQLVGEPLSLVQPGRAINPVDALHFDDGPARRSSTLVQRLLKSNTPDQVDTDDDQTPTVQVPAPLTDLRSLIEREAQRGCAGVAPGVIGDRVAQAHHALRQIGLTAFADPDSAVAPPELLLRSLYLIQRVEQAVLVS